MLSKGDRDNFDTLLKAARNADLALLEVRRRSDGAVVAAVCAVSKNAADSEDAYTFVPLAIMVEGNPYELFDAPVPNGGYKNEEERSV